MEILILLLKIIFILYFIGYGFTAVLIPEKLRKDSFFMIPWVGLIFITVIGIALSMTQVPLVQSKYIIFAVASMMIIYSFYGIYLLKIIASESGHLKNCLSVY